MQRHAMLYLHHWAKQDIHKPLIVLGARQVGKTYLLRELGAQHFSDSIYVNFEETPGIQSLFADDLKPQSIVHNLELIFKRKILPEKTLVIFDEIQEAPRALTSLKYFQESLPQLHVAAAGSLLGLKMPKSHSFPVGKVEFLNLYPMSIQEFFESLGEHTLLQALQDCLIKNQIFPDIMHTKCLEILKLYYFVGGMPEAVQAYLTGASTERIRAIQKAILTSYQLDISRHASATDIQKIFRIWESLPHQLARENKRFTFGDLGKGARMRSYESAIQWLSDAGLVIRCDRISAGRLPLAGYVDEGIFKMYPLDVGLLGAMSSVDAEIITQGSKIFTEFKGAFAESFVAQSLINQGFRPFYWNSEGKAEVDFVIEHLGKVLPIEVKSGENIRAQSLQVFRDKFQASVTITASLLNIRRNMQHLNLPLYATSLIPLVIPCSESQGRLV